MRNTTISNKKNSRREENNIDVAGMLNKNSQDNKKNTDALVPKNEKKFSCPRCASIFNIRKMEKITHPSGAILDICKQCGGMWIDRDEVKLLFDFSEKQSKR